LKSQVLNITNLKELEHTIASFYILKYLEEEEEEANANFVLIF